jgi:hypothetical protein
LVLKNPNQWIRVLFLALKKRLIIVDADCKLKEISKEKREKWKGVGSYTKMYKQLRNANGRLIGLIQDRMDVIELRSADGRLLGFYYRKNNLTRDSSGKLIGYGNLLTNLLCRV